MTATLRQISGPTGFAATLTPFKGSNIQGISGATSTSGRMPLGALTQYNAHRDANAIAYTVVSYSTPIAWVLNDGTVIDPGYSYSVTTQRHRSRVLPWLATAIATSPAKVLIAA